MKYFYPNQNTDSDRPSSLQYPGTNLPDSINKVIERDQSSGHGSPRIRNVFTMASIPSPARRLAYVPHMGFPQPKYYDKRFSNDRTVTNVKKWGLFSRHYRSGRPTEIERCIDQVQAEGTYRYISSGDSDPGLCSIYILSPPDKVVEIDVQEMNIDCNGGLIGLLDGWELNQEVFPGWEDGSKSREDRLKFFCGESGPSKPVVSSQNLLNIKHRIPNVGEGFSFTVRFIDNPEPCNVLLMAPTGAYTLQNYGKARNCSVSIVHPEKVNIMDMDIGSTRDGKHHKTLGVRRQCMESGDRDYAEFLFGSGMQPDYMRLGDNDMCGTKNGVGSLILLPCGYSVVRMVSSGQYVNSISFQFDRVTDDEFDQLAAMGHTIEC